MIKKISVKEIDIGTDEQPEFIVEITLIKSFLFIKYNVVFRRVHGEVFRFSRGRYSLPSLYYSHVEKYFETYC